MLTLCMPVKKNRWPKLSISKPSKRSNMELTAKPLAGVVEKDNSIPLPLIVSDAFIAKILTPYRDNAKYLSSAQIIQYHDPGPDGHALKRENDLVTIEGRFSIPESCYIDDTGHFNAVEFNICYNQLAYVLFGKCIQTGILHKLVYDWEGRVNLSFDLFLKYQLSSMFIAKIEGNFLKPLNARDFRARLTVNRIMWADETAFVKTQISFDDGKGTKSKGSVLLAFRIFNSL